MQKGKQGASPNRRPENTAKESNPSKEGSTSPVGSPSTTRHTIVSQEGLELYKHYTREDRYLDWLFRPHSLIMLSLGGIFLVYVAFFEPAQPTFESRIKTGLICSALGFLLFAALQFKDTLFVRPHPVVWRIITGIGVLYLLILVFLLFQTVDDVRWMLSRLDPSLGKPLPERTYAENCDYDNFILALYDEFMLAHFFGWFGKAFLFRDWGLCWVMSILFEIMEVSFEHMLPNFGECWWDHVILDVFGMNFLGFSFGMWVLNKFSMKSFSWVEPVVNLERFQWSILSGPKRLLAVVALVAVINQIELNAFFLKFILWIPPSHYINVGRLLLWWSIGLSGTREYYQYCTDKNCKKLGPVSWLCVAVMGVELLLSIKFGRGLFPNPAPEFVIYGWIIFLVAFLLWAFWFYGFYKAKKE